MGTPSNPEKGDYVTLYEFDGTPRAFTIIFVDEDVVTLSSITKVAHLTRKQFERLFEKGDGDDR